MIDLTKEIGHKHVYDLFSFCVFKPNENKIQNLYKDYQHSVNKYLFGLKIGNENVALIGVEVKSKACAEIRHLAVMPSYRRQGLGKKLIMDCKNNFNISSLIVETDDDAVNFYKRIGFKVIKTDTKYEGIIRYTLVLSNTANE